ncbi:hypothetical protein EBZ38_03895 [bacterium]|nr:hypothetical protein [bacterium]
MKKKIETLPNLKKGSCTYHIAMALLNGRRLSQLEVDKLLETKGIYRTDMGRKKRKALEWLREHDLQVSYLVGPKNERRYWVSAPYSVLQEIKGKLKGATK